LNRGSSAILNIIVKVKNEGIVINTTSFFLDKYNNNHQTNESSVNVNVTVAPNNSGGDGNDTNSSDSSSGGNGSGMFGNGLAKAGFPLILLLLSVLSVYYCRRK